MHRQHAAWQRPQSLAAASSCVHYRSSFLPQRNTQSPGIILACLKQIVSQSQGTWADGPEDGGIARTHAARLLAELANQPGMHSLLVQSQAANAIAESVAAMVRMVSLVTCCRAGRGLCCSVREDPSHSACVSCMDVDRGGCKSCADGKEW